MFKTQEQHLADLQRDAKLGQSVRELVEGSGTTTRKPRRAKAKRRKVKRAPVSAQPATRPMVTRPAPTPNGNPKKRGLTLAEVEEMEVEEVES